MINKWTLLIFYSHLWKIVFMSNSCTLLKIWWSVHNFFFSIFFHCPIDKKTSDILAIIHFYIKFKPLSVVCHLLLIILIIIYNAKSVKFRINLKLFGLHCFVKSVKPKGFIKRVVILLVITFSSATHTITKNNGQLLPHFFFLTTLPFLLTTL